MPRHSMVWDSHSQIHKKPIVDEQGRAISFLTGTSTTHDVTKAQRHFLLGHAIDLNTIVWVISIYLVVKQHHDGHFLALRLECNG